MLFNRFIQITCPLQSPFCKSKAKAKAKQKQKQSKTTQNNAEAKQKQSKSKVKAKQQASKATAKQKQSKSKAKATQKAKQCYVSCFSLICVTSSLEIALCLKKKKEWGATLPCCDGCNIVRVFSSRQPPQPCNFLKWTEFFCNTVLVVKLHFFLGGQPEFPAETLHFLFFCIQMRTFASAASTSNKV